MRFNETKLTIKPAIKQATKGQANVLSPKNMGSSQNRTQFPYQSYVGS